MVSADIGSLKYVPPVGFGQEPKSKNHQWNFFSLEGKAQPFKSPKLHGIKHGYWYIFALTFWRATKTILWWSSIIKIDKHFLVQLKEVSIPIAPVANCNSFIWKEIENTAIVFFLTIKLSTDLWVLRDCILKYGFETSHFGKMNLGPVEHFFNILVLTFGSVCYCTQQTHPKVRKWGQICWKSVQLVKGSSFWNDLLQNPYNRATGHATMTGS